MLLNKEILSGDKGISFSSIKSEKFKTGVLSFSINLALTPKTVVCNLLLSGLLRRGSGRFPSMSKLNRHLDELYGSYVEIRSSHVGNNLSLVITSEVLDNRFIPDGTDALGGVIEVISDIILNPLIKNSDFDKQAFLQEKKVTTEALLSEKNNTRVYSIKRCAELISEGTSMYPTCEELMSLVSDLTFEDVLEHYRSTILGAPMDIFYIGATDPEAVKAKALSALEEYPCSKPYSPAPLKAYKRKEFAAVTEKMAVSQGKLAMGFSTGVHISPDDDKYYAALMLNEIFGGSPSSKLFLNVREKMSLCYYCSSTFSIYTGVMMVSSGIEVDKLETAKSAILKQLEQIKLGNITNTELEAARRSIANSYRQLYDNPFDMQAFYSGRAMFGVNDSIEDCRQKLLAVSIDDITEVAKQITLDSVFFVEGTEISNDTEELDND